MSIKTTLPTPSAPQEDLRCSARCSAARRRSGSTAASDGDAGRSSAPVIPPQLPPTPPAPPLLLGVATPQALQPWLPAPNSRARGHDGMGTSGDGDPRGGSGGAAGCGGRGAAGAATAARGSSAPSDIGRTLSRACARRVTPALRASHRRSRRTRFCDITSLRYRLLVSGRVPGTGEVVGEPTGLCVAEPPTPCEPGDASGSSRARFEPAGHSGEKAPMEEGELGDERIAQGATSPSSPGGGGEHENGCIQLRVGGVRRGDSREGLALKPHCECCCRTARGPRETCKQAAIARA